MLAKISPKLVFLAQNGGFCIFLGIPSLLFSENLQLIRAFNSEKKCSNRFFEKNSRFAHFVQKLSKIGHLAGCVHESL